MISARRFALVVSLLATACTHTTGTIDLTLAVDPGVTDATLSQVTQLHLATIGDISDETTYTLVGPLPRQERIELLPVPDHATLTIAVEARDAVGNVLLSGVSPGEILKSGAILRVTIPLTIPSGLPDAGGDLASAGDAFAANDLTAGPPDLAPLLPLTVSPTRTLVGAKQSLQLTASDSVAWAVVESNGGTIDASSGLYTAPAAVGDFHVTATRAIDNAVQMVTIGVRASGVERLAGQLGGKGYYEATGAAARLGSIGGIGTYNGNVYYTDASAHVVRSANLATNSSSLWIGMPGVAGYHDDASGANAQFNSPAGILADAAGITIVDSANNCIRHSDYSSSKAVSTIAGTGATGSNEGAAATATFNGPSGICLSSPGDYFITDTSNQTIRRLKAGVVSTFAGTTGSQGGKDGTGTGALFDLPIGIACDASYVYVGDSFNSKIRRIHIADAVVDTLLGTGSPGGADGMYPTATSGFVDALTFDAAGNLMLADTSQDIIRSLVASSKTVSTLLGANGMPGSTDGIGALARFNGPCAIASLQSASDYLVGECGNGTLRRFSLPQTFASTTPLGKPAQPGYANGATAASLFAQPMGVAVDDHGTAYITDHDNRRIRTVDLLTGEANDFAGTGANAVVNGAFASAAFKDPLGITYLNGKLYVADGTAHRIAVLDLATGQVATLFGQGGTGGYMDGSFADALVGDPHDVTSDGVNHLYVADTVNNMIRAVDLDLQQVSTVAGSMAKDGGYVNAVGGAARFGFPAGVIWRGGTLYVTELDNHAIRSVDIASGTVATLAGTQAPGYAEGASAVFRDLRQMAFDDSGALLVADAGNHVIRRIVVATHQASTAVGAFPSAVTLPGSLSTARLNTPNGLAALPGGSLVIVDRGENAILVAHGAVP